MGWRCIVKGSTFVVLLGVAGCGPSKGMRPDAAGIGGIGLAGGGGGGGAGAVSGTGGVGGSVGGSSGLGGSVGSGGGATTITRKFAVSLSNQRAVDILFLIDDSSFMTAAQTTLHQSFGRFVAALRAAPGGLPDLHVAVVSSDMGAGDGSISGCNSTGGHQGIFQYTGRGACTTGLQPNATFISDVGGVKNYTGNLEDVLGCIASLGETGCGFEHQFAAITRALGVDGFGAAPAENQAFLRPDAYLAVILLTNEDDCSAAPGAGPNSRIPLFDTSANTNMASQLGPPQNFRCNEFGHMCARGGGAPMHPDRNAPNLDMTQMVTYDSCTSNDAEGYLLSAADTANRLKALKSDPNKVFVAAITGPASPYTVTWKAPSTADTSCNANGKPCPWPVMAHACTAANGSNADPGVRTTAFVSQFGDHGLAASICDADFGPVLEGLAAKIGAAIAGPCISDPIADDPTRAGYQPLCSAELFVSNGQGSFTDQAVPPCADNGGATPCWSLATDAAGCQRPQISFGAAPPTMTATVSYQCAVCSSGVVGQGCSDPGRTTDTVGRTPIFGNACEVGAGVTGGPGAVSLTSVTTQCGFGGACLLPAADYSNVTTGPLCTSSCTTTADCAGGTVANANDPNDHRCKKGFVCMVPTTVGDFCCQQMCVCRDFVAEPVGGFKTPAVCVPGAVGTCPNLH